MSLVHDIARARLGLAPDAVLNVELKEQLDVFEKRMKRDPFKYDTPSLAKIIDEWEVPQIRKKVSDGT